MEIQLVILMFIIQYVLSLLFNIKNEYICCGLLGYSGKKRANINLLKLIFIDNKERGIHSCGISSIFKPKNSNAVTFKSLLPSDKAMAENDIQPLLKGFEIICHTRYATMGDHSIDNAHPYEYGNIIGTHNGWLIDYKKCRVTDEQYSFSNFVERNNYDKELLNVDSKGIFYHLNETNDINSLEDIEGAMALAFLKDGNLHLYRRESKPLYVYKGKDFIYYSSRIESFNLILGKEKASKQVVLIDPNIVFVFNKGELLKKIKIKKPEVVIKLDQLPSSFYHERSYNSAVTRNHSRKSNKDTAVIIRNENITKNMHLLNNVFDDYTGYSHGMLNKKYIEINPLISNRKLISTNKSKSTIIIVKLTDYNHFNFKILIDGCPESLKVIGNSGKRVSLKVPTRFIKEDGSVNILIIPDNNFFKELHGNKYFTQVFYKAKIYHLKEGDIVNVSISIPFINKEYKDRKIILNTLKICKNKEVESTEDNSFLEKKEINENNYNDISPLSNFIKLSDDEFRILEDELNAFSDLYFICESFIKDESKNLTTKEREDRITSCYLYLADHITNCSNDFPSYHFNLKLINIRSLFLESISHPMYKKFSTLDITVKFISKVYAELSSIIDDIQDILEYNDHNSNYLKY